MGADSAAQAKHRLNQQRWLDELAIDKMRGRIKMANVVTLDLKARVILTARFQDISDVFKRILEHPIVAIREIRALPIVFEIFVTPEHFIQPEVHRAHVERRDFGFQL